MVLPLRQPTPPPGLLAALQAPLPMRGPAPLPPMPPAPPMIPGLPGMAPPTPPPPMGMPPLGMLSPTMVPNFGMPMGQADEPGSGPAVDPDRRQTPRRKKPSEDQIRQMADRIVEYWTLRDTRMDEDYALYRLSRAGYNGSGELILRNLPYILVEKAAALIGKQKPNIDIIPPSLDLRDEAQAVEDWLRYKWDVWGDEWGESLHNSLRRDAGHYLALRGWITSRIIYDSESEDEDVLNDPVRNVLVDPRQVYPSVGTKGLKFVVHRYVTTIGDLRDEWPEAEKLFDDEADPEETIEVTAYYDDWYHCVYCDAGVVKPPEAHEYGFVPWHVGVGMGSPIRATTSNQTDWVADVGVSIFHGIKDAYKQLNKVLSQLATEIAKAANPPIIHYYDPANPEQPKRLKYHAGAVNYMMYDREKAEPLSLSPNPRDASPLIDALRDDINMGGLPPILWGAGAGASGYQQSLMADAAEDALFPLIEAMTRFIRNSNKRAMELIRDLHDREVGYFVRDQQSGQWQSGITLDPETIAEVGTHNRVTFRNISPRDRMQMANLAQMLTKEKLISMDTARNDYLDLENPSRENEKVLTDLVYLDDDVVKTFVEAALQRTEPELYMLYQQAKMKQQQPQGMPGMPGAPAGPEMPGMPPNMPPSGPQGLPPQLMPPIQQAGAADPMAGLLQSLGSAAGGMGLQRPPGLAGSGAMPRPPLPIPGMI